MRIVILQHPSTCFFGYFGRVSFAESIGFAEINADAPVLNMEIVRLQNLGCVVLHDGDFPSLEAAQKFFDKKIKPTLGLSDAEIVADETDGEGEQTTTPDGEGVPTPPIGDGAENPADDQSTPPEVTNADNNEQSVSADDGDGGSGVSLPRSDAGIDGGSGETETPEVSKSSKKKGGKVPG